MPLTLLIDGDVLAYKAAFGVEKAVGWGDGLWTNWADEQEGRDTFDGLIQDIVEALNPTHVIVALSDKENFRKAILPTYKSNRKDTRRPLLLAPIKEHIRQAYTVYERPTLEGDDILGILSTHPSLVKGTKVIVSVDKDFKTIPGQFYDLGNTELGIQTITEAQANYYHLLQTLTGDTSDGYKGCPGLGPKRAADLLNADCSWATVVSAYQKAKLSEEEALVQARVARILRASDYNFKTKQPILWEPTP